MATDVELLTLVDAAITSILTGSPAQSYTNAKGESLSYLSLAELQAMRNQLTAGIRRQSGPRTMRSATRTRVNRL